jgi:hypothetical protein
MLSVSIRMKLAWEVQDLLNDLHEAGYAAEVVQDFNVLLIDEPEEKLPDINLFTYPKVAQVASKELLQRIRRHKEQAAS